jgi:hypothetical protein
MEPGRSPGRLELDLAGGGRHCGRVGIRLDLAASQARAGL